MIARVLWVFLVVTILDELTNGRLAGIEKERSEVEDKHPPLPPLPPPSPPPPPPPLPRPPPPAVEKGGGECQGEACREEGQG